MGPGADSTRPRRLMLGPGSVIAAIRCRQHEERIEGSLPAKARRQAADELFRADFTHGKVPGVGLEPTRRCRPEGLSLVRLPIPPSGRCVAQPTDNGDADGWRAIPPPGRGTADRPHDPAHAAARGLRMHL